MRKRSRVLLVVGCAPSTFATIYSMLPASLPTSVRFVWINPSQPAPALPGGRSWDVELRCKAEDVPTLPQALEWAQSKLFVVMGAGSTLDATGLTYEPLKQAAEHGDPYAFDREHLHASASAPLFASDGTPLPMEPLCVRLLRLTAKIRAAYLSGKRPAFLRWLAERTTTDGVSGVISFNVDQMEQATLPRTLASRIVLLHGHLGELTTVSELARPYYERDVWEAEGAPPPPPDDLQCSSSLLSRQQRRAKSTRAANSAAQVAAAAASSSDEDDGPLPNAVLLWNDPAALSVISNRATAPLTSLLLEEKSATCMVVPPDLAFQPYGRSESSSSSSSGSGSSGSGSSGSGSSGSDGSGSSGSGSSGSGSSGSGSSGSDGEVDESERLPKRRSLRQGVQSQADLQKAAELYIAAGASGFGSDDDECFTSPASKRARGSGDSGSRCDAPPTAPATPPPPQVCAMPPAAPATPPPLQVGAEPQCTPLKKEPAKKRVQQLEAGVVESVYAGEQRRSSRLTAAAACDVTKKRSKEARTSAGGSSRKRVLSEGTEVGVSRRGSKKPQKSGSQSGGGRKAKKSENEPAQKERRTSLGSLERETDIRRANVVFKQALRGLVVPNLVYCGDWLDAAVARKAKQLLSKFLGGKD